MTKCDVLTNASIRRRFGDASMSNGMHDNERVEPDRSNATLLKARHDNMFPTRRAWYSTLLIVCSGLPAHTSASFGQPSASLSVTVSASCRCFLHGEATQSRCSNVWSPVRTHKDKNGTAPTTMSAHLLPASVQSLFISGANVGTMP